MAKKKKGYGGIPRATIDKMTHDYVVKQMSIADISTNYCTAQATIYRIATKRDWKWRKRDWDQRSIKKATTERSKVANNIIGKAMKILERKSNYLDVIMDAIPISEPIPKKHVDDALMLMNAMDRVHHIIKSTRENTNPDTILVEGIEGLTAIGVEERFNAMKGKVNAQLEEFKERRGYLNHDADEEDTDVFEAQTTKTKDDDDEIHFAGAEDDDDEPEDNEGQSSIGGIL